MPTTQIQNTLQERFGLEALRPLQQEIIDRVLDGGDALVVMPTGSGKSLCFQLPALVMNEECGGEGVGLVFSPLIALMEDQVHALTKRGIRAAYVNSTVSKQERRKRYEKLARGEYELFYATPERMTKDDFREALDQVPGGVNLLAIDECHCVTKWGHDLRPAYQRIGEFRKELGEPVTIALTATATKAVRADVRAVLGVDEKSMPLYAAPVDRPNLKLRSEVVWDDEDKIEKLQSTLKGIEGTSIVYFTLIKDLERMAPQIMRKMDRPVEVYHGRLPANERRRVYNQFINATPRENLLLCATNAFGMGVDKADLRSVIHAQLPGSVEAYHQEVGRAGRDGLPAICKILYAQSDLTIQQEFIRWQNPTPDLLMQTMSAIEARFAHDDFDSDDLRIHVIGKGHAHGLGGGVMDYVLIRLAELGAIELTNLQSNERGQGRYRYMRTIDDDEIDADSINEKLKRDLTRLLDVVNLTKAPDIPAYITEYFDL
ncbi:MAG: ATP-dependent DNA helicase RecQ [Phycisphaerales bacterium]|nr:ATP-dependent DNA helicase RecQ [Phycisphaerales bacterium]